ncbi:MAG: GIY-YIG nuclease family protein [Bryobacterales bacterium]|nr:GIY-YIG nuclease family protein [Bryobacterales bacterium]
MFKIPHQRDDSSLVVSPPGDLFGRGNAHRRASGNGMIWRSKRVSSSNSGVPAAAGVYLIGHSSTLHDLEVRRSYVYVGETKNLQRRLNEHLPANEKNPGLREYIENNYDDAICWFARAGAAEAKAIQDDLILRLRPRFNIVGNHPTNREEQT